MGFDHLHHSKRKNAGENVIRQQAAVSASFNARTFPVFYAVCERGVLTAMYDFAFHIRGADCVSRNRLYTLVNA
jgi:hypothetical protein